MRIAIEFPVALFRQAQASAVTRGVALKERLRHGAKADARETGEPPWMAGFGGLSGLDDEHRRVRKAIEDEFEGGCRQRIVRVRRRKSIDSAFNAYGRVGRQEAGDNGG